MAKISASIYGRLLLVLLICSLIAAPAAAILLYAAKVIYINVPLPPNVNFFIRQTYVNYGKLNLFFIGITILTIIFYCLWMMNRISYFRLIRNSTQQLSKGDFNLEIPVRDKGPLSSIAQNLNQVKGQLETLIEEEKRAIRTKNELVTNVSHDLRTPLTSIIGYLRLIEEDQYRDEVELRYYIHIAYEKALRLNGMVNDLFEFTKINNREVSLRKIGFNLNELLRQLSAQFHPELIAAGMEIEIESTNDEIMIEADPDKLMRVFENLIANAIKYGKTGKKVDLTVEKKEHHVMVKVINYGQPIPAKAIPFIFERMYRVEQSRSDETGGTGLGLAIAKGIVELHKGSITVKSNEAETFFQVQLPLN
ncbi:sensor histidine kinase [Neobacillus mesonae]|uniref:sensor histidine kinase n=1 Tax=Neobacillus mesonae TaxID=1193713 RepID=UPI002573D91F|nr:HAMP domain-containing sensor histidine kinase [Neobacillus mesonae]